MSQDSIPPLDLKPEIEFLWPEIQPAVERVIRSGYFIGGPEVQAFEEEAASYLGVEHAVSMNSGTDALVIGLRALGVEPGDEILTSSFTFFATGESISNVGAVPVFVDIDPVTLNVDPAKLEEKITAKTKGIMPVHLFGQAVDHDALQAVADKHGLFVIEDACQAWGSAYKSRKVGGLGRCAAFSFFPTKNLGGFGDGGLLSTNEAGIAEAARLLKAHGSKKRYHNEVLGYNSRLDAIQAAVLRLKLPHIDEWNAGRQRVAARYDEAFAELEAVTPPGRNGDASHVFHQYVVRIAGGRRDALRETLKDRGVNTMVYYPVPVHRMPMYDLPLGSLPETEAAAEEVLALPIWGLMEEALQDQIIAAVKSALA